MGASKGLITVLMFLMAVSATVVAAPLPPFEPVDITGTIDKAEWVPERTAKAVPGMSGSAGIDRVFPAHFLVILGNYAGVDTRTARRMNFLLGYTLTPDGNIEEGPESILLRLPHHSKLFLDGVRKITVRGYRIRGDEGGTWTSYDRIEILERAR